MCDLDSPLVLAYDTFAATHDAGMIGPMLERTTDLVGHKLDELLADSGYVSIHDLESCSAANVELFAPWQENDYSEQQGKKKGSNQFTQIPKTDFKWLEADQTFICPEGHRLEFHTTKKERRLDYDITLRMYVCPAEHCCGCPRQTHCTPNPKKGRTVSRMENEFYVGTIKGVGRIYQQTVIDTYSRVAFAKLYERKIALTAADMLNDRVLPFFEDEDVPVLRMLTDRGTEYCGNREHHEYQLYLAVENIDHSKTRSKRPQSNGICERFHKTMLQEFYQVAFRKKVYQSIDELQEGAVYGPTSSRSP